jgi:cell division protein FtsL
MATWAGFFKQSDVATSVEGREAIRAQEWREPIRAQVDPFRLRSLPNDQIYFWSKRIDNSRVVRQNDPAARGECLSAMAAAVLLVVLAVSIIAPRAALMMEGYKLESLKVEHQTLLDQKRELEVREASLLSPQRLVELAKANNLASPGVDQVIHLQGQSDVSYASNKAPRNNAINPASARNH